MVLTKKGSWQSAGNDGSGPKTVNDYTGEHCKKHPGTNRQDCHPK